MTTARKVLLVGFAAIALGLCGWRPTSEVAASGPGSLAQPYYLISSPTLTTNGGRVDWSVDGQWIYYDQVNTSGHYDVRKIHPDGTADACLTCNRSELSSGDKGNPTVDPSGRYVVFEAEAPSHPPVVGNGVSVPTAPGSGWYNDLWVLDQNTSTLTQLTHVNTGNPAGGSLHPHFNHDGTKLLWSDLLGAGGRFGTWQLATATFTPAPTPQLSNRANYQPGDRKVWYEAHGWGPDDSWVYFACAPLIGQDDFTMDICRMDFSNPTQVTRLTQSSGLNGEPAEWDEHAHLSPQGDVMSWVSSRGYQVQNYQPWESWLTTEVWMMNPDGSGQTRETYFNEPGHPESLPGRNIPADHSWNMASTDPESLVIATSPGINPTTSDLILNFSHTPPPPPRPLTVTPTSAATGSTVTVSGGSFDVGETVTVTTPSFMTVATAAADGSISASGPVDAGLTPGAYVVFARGTSSTLFQSTTLSVTAASPTAVLSPASSPAGAPITVNLTGFGANESVVVAGLQNSTSATTDSTGAASVSLSPWSSTNPGVYLVSARGRNSGRQASASLTVTASQASITLSPTTASMNTVVTATAAGFAPGESVAFSGLGFIGNSAANASGIATLTNTITGVYPDGTYVIVATGLTTGTVASGNLQVTEAGSHAITLSPSSINAGDTVSVSSTGFQAGEPVTLFGPATTTIAAADTTGSVNASIQVGQTITSGRYLVSITGSRSGAQTSGTLAVIPSNASVTVSPTLATAGSTISISGTGFQSGEKVVLSGPRINTSAIADTTGAFSVQAALNASLPAALCTIQATGTSSRLEATTSIAVSGGTQHGSVTIATAPAVQAGATYTVNVGGLAAGGGYTVFVPSGVPVTGTADAFGMATLSLTMPFQQAPGTYVVQVTAGINNAASVIAVTRPNQVVNAPSTAQVAGSTVQVGGRGFAANETVSISGFWAAVASAVADSTGSFTTNITLGRSIPNGALSIVASGNTSRWAGNRRLMVDASGGPTVNPWETPVAAGATATYTLSGFVGGETVDVSVPGLSFGSVSVSTDGTGAGTASIPIPRNAVAGNYLIVASGSSDRAYGIQPVSTTPATLTISPATAIAGGSVTATGSGFQPGETISLAGPGSTIAPVADGNGNWTATFVPPAWLSTGTINVAALGRTSRLRVDHALAVAARLQTLTVAPTSANPAAPIVVSGTGMLPGDDVLLTGPFLSPTVTADSTGAFSASTQIGSAYVSGTYGLRALDTTAGISADAVIALTQTP
jgi:hypothetical protein